MSDGTYHWLPYETIEARPLDKAEVRLLARELHGLYLSWLGRQLAFEKQVNDALKDAVQGDPEPDVIVEAADARQ